MACGERRTEEGSAGAIVLPASPRSSGPPPSLSPSLPGPASPPGPASLPPAGARDPRRGRAVLLLSLTILVWYGGITARRYLGPAPEALLEGRGGVPDPRPAESGGDPAAPGHAEGARPLTVRQMYLLGRRIDINRAESREISELPGITDETAREVVEVRSRLGRFQRPEDLLAVRGIKEKRLKKILPFLAGFSNN